MSKEKSLDKVLEEQEKILADNEEDIDRINKYDRQIIDSLYPYIIFVGGIFVGFLLNLMASALDRFLSTQSWYLIYLVSLLIISIGSILLIVKILPFENLLISLRIRRTRSIVKRARQSIAWGKSINRDLKLIEGSEPVPIRSLLRLLGLDLRLKLKNYIK